MLRDILFHKHNLEVNDGATKKLSVFGPLKQCL